MKLNRSIPSSAVIPVLIYPDVREAVAWLSAAFGFVERLQIGDWTFSETLDDVHPEVWGGTLVG